MGTALQTSRFKPGLNFVSNTGYKRSLHKDSKDGFKDIRDFVVLGAGDF